MKNWNYFELTATLYKSYFLYKEQGDSSEHAIARMGLDFWFYPENENIVENLLLITTSLSVKISLFKKVNKRSVDLFKNQLLMINDDLLSNELEPNEKEHLTETIEEIKYKLKTIEITESPI